MGLDPGLARKFSVYGAVLIGGSAFTAFWSIIPDSIVKAHHDTKSTMWAGIWSNLINVGLNTIFLFVLHWGVFGIAFSTVLGRFGGLVYALRKAARHEAARQASGLDTDPTLDPHPLLSFLSLAVPSTMTYGLMAVETGLVTWLLARQPNATESIAAYGISSRVLQFAAMPIIAATVAVLPYVARRFGEGDIRAIRDGMRQILLVAVVYCDQEDLAHPVTDRPDVPLAEAARDVGQHRDRSGDDRHGRELQDARGDAVGGDRLGRVRLPGQEPGHQPRLHRHESVRHGRGHREGEKRKQGVRVEGRVGVEAAGLARRLVPGGLAQRVHQPAEPSQDGRE